jgi:hypothetical protein
MKSLNRPVDCLVLAAGLFFFGGCEAQIVVDEEGVGDDTWYDGEADASLADDGVLYISGITVQDAVFSSCTTSVVRGLSDQLVDEIECLRPGTLKSIANVPNLSLGSSVFPYLQEGAATALKNAAAAGGTIHVNSALRSLAQQFLLYSWYKNGLCTNVVSLAAQPGTSNHERGLAIDTSDYSAAKSRLENRGFRWLGNSDVVHFDYTAGGADLSTLSVRAFQGLWNANHPGDKIGVDGVYGPETESRLRKAPAAGFAIGSTCSASTQPIEIKPMAIRWDRDNSDGSYDFRVSAPAGVSRVKYTVDGYQIGSVTRELGGDDFAISYTFNYELAARGFKAEGFNTDGVKIAEGIGLIDSVPGAAVFIWQRGDRIYSVGVERSGGAAIELRVDGNLVTDSISGETYSTRMAVRHTYSTLGARHFQVKVFNATGAVIQTFERDFTLK